MVSNKTAFSSIEALASFALTSSIPDNNNAPKINDPKAPAVLLAIPIMAIRFAPLSIGPKIVI